MFTKVSHITLFVHDQNQVLEFYTEKFGFVVHTDAQFGDMHWLTVHPAQQPDFEVALLLAKTAEGKALVGKQADSKPFITLATDDCVADFALLKERGVTIVEEPATQPWGIAAACKDVCGNIIYVCQAL